eukprot:556254-Rhodomonas_salina.2
MDGNNGLLNEEFKTGKGIPFIALEGEGENEKFRLMDEAKAFLMQVQILPQQKEVCVWVPASTLQSGVSIF